MMTETVFDLWAAWETGTQPAPGGQPIFFGLADPGVEEIAQFQMDLPPDPVLADERLEAAQAAVERAGQALEAIPGRLDRLVRQAQSGEATAASFAVGGPDSLGPAEAELLDSLGSLPGGPEVNSFGLAEQLPDWKESYREFLEAFEHLQQLLTHLAWVETSQDGNLQARTVVDWSGDLGTVWAIQVKEDFFGLHKRSLEVALASRLALLKLITTTVQAAAKLSILLATPGAQVLALPAAWRYVNQLVKEYQAYRAITIQTGG